MDAIIQLDRPKTLKHLRAFLGAVNYYKDMWPRRAHVLKPLTYKYGTNTFVWTNEMEEPFKEKKSLRAMDCLSQYPNHNLGFDIYIDARDYQMGACIMQNGKPLRIGP